MRSTLCHSKSAIALAGVVIALLGWYAYRVAPDASLLLPFTSWAVPLAVVWLASPAISRALSRPEERAEQRLSPAGRADALRYARLHWAYFDRFFRELLQWTSREVDAGRFGTYTLFQAAGQDVAGMMNPTPDTPGKGPYWHSYDFRGRRRRVRRSPGGARRQPPRSAARGPPVRTRLRRRRSHWGGRAPGPTGSW